MKEIEQIARAESIEALEKLRVDLLGKKSALSEAFAKLKDVEDKAAGWVSIMAASL